MTIFGQFRRLVRGIHSPRYIPTTEQLIARRERKASNALIQVRTARAILPPRLGHRPWARRLGPRRLL